MRAVRLLETETQLLLSERLDYLDRETAEVLMAEAAELGRILNGLIKSLEKSRR